MGLAFSATTIALVISLVIALASEFSTCPQLLRSLSLVLEESRKCRNFLSCLLVTIIFLASISSAVSLPRPDSSRYPRISNFSSDLTVVGRHSRLDSYPALLTFSVYLRATCAARRKRHFFRIIDCAKYFPGRRFLLLSRSKLRSSLALTRLVSTPRESRLDLQKKSLACHKKAFIANAPRKCFSQPLRRDSITRQNYASPSLMH